MSDYDINKMDVKQLRNEVQLLRDELAIFKRKYEDILYNLDDDNFSSNLVKEKEGMKTSIEQTEESIKLQAEKVTENSQNISTLKITAEEIESTVFEKNDDGTKTSKIQQTADAIKSEVTARKNADDQIETQMSSIEQTATQIQTKVSNALLGKYENGKYTIYTQTNDTFYFDGDFMRIRSAIILTDNNMNPAFSIFHDESNNSPTGGAVYLWGNGEQHKFGPVVIGNNDSYGNTQPIYLYSITENNRIATRGWVLENGGVAKFA